MCKKQLIKFALASIAILGPSVAIAGVSQISSSFGETNTWTEFSLSNGNSASIWKWGGALTRTGNESGVVNTGYLWSSMGRDHTFSQWGSRTFNSCSMGVYVMGDAGYLEAIDTATWTYLAPLAHKAASGSFSKVSINGYSPRQNMFLRYVVPTSGGTKTAFMDDAYVVCQWD